MEVWRRQSIGNIRERDNTAIKPPMSREQKREEVRREAIRIKKNALGSARERYMKRKKSAITGPRVVRIISPSTGVRFRKVGKDRPGPGEGGKEEDE